MSNSKNKTNFSDTIKWASLEKARRDDSPKGVSTSLLIIGGIVFLLCIIFIIYIMSGSDEQNTLDMLKDDKYIYYGDESGETD